MSKGKIGIIDVGGGMRDIYGAGVFDYLLDNNVEIEYCLGVSAGSANVASYVAKQKGRNKVYYDEYSFEKDYMSFHNFIHKGSYIDLEYIYGTLSNEDGKYPWDFDRAMENPAEMVVSATDAKEGKTVYFTKKDFEKNDYGMLKASSCIPIVCKPYNWRGKYYFDGGIANPIPIDRAFEDGCTKVIIILTRPLDYRKKSKKRKIYKTLNKTFPKMVERLEKRCDLYNSQLDNILQKYAPDGKAFVLAPSDVCGVSTLRFTKEHLDLLYNKGYEDGKKVKEFLEKNN